MEERKLTRKDLRRCWRAWMMHNLSSMSFERLESFGFCLSMLPVAKKLYPDPAQRTEMLRRHASFYNTEPQIGAIVNGMVLGLEEKKANGEPIDGETINTLKVGLMGPLAGMGDSIIWAAVMPLLIAIFIPFAASGSAMGGIVPLILYPAITLAISYGMVHKGYTLGRDSIIGLLQGGRIKELIYGANVLGLIMMGALSASYVKITTPLKLSALKGSEVVVQQILDSIAPGLLPLAAVFAIYFYLVKKGPRYTTILLSIVALSVVCSLLGVL